MSSRTAFLVGSIVFAVLTCVIAWSVRERDEPGSTARPQPVAPVMDSVLPAADQGVLPQAILPASDDAQDKEPSQPPPIPVARDAAADASALSRPVTVIVVDGNGHPVPDALVEVFFEADASAAIPVLTSMLAGLPGTPSDPERVMDLARRMYANREFDPTWVDPSAVWTTDADGAAAVQTAERRTYLVATHPELGSSGVVTYRAAGKESTPTSIRLKLSPRGKLHGRVLDVSGQPVPGARVSFARAFLPDEEKGRPRIPQPMETGADGLFEAEVDTRFFSSVHAESGERRTLAEYVHVQPGHGSSVELRFPGAYAVTGLVLGPSGAPVAGASVDVAGYQIHVDPVETDTDGGFRLELAKPGHIVLIVSSAGLVTGDVVAATLSDSAPQADVLVHLVEAAPIAGRLQDSDGKPITRAMLFASPATPDLAHDMAALRAWAERGADAHDFEASFSDSAYTDAGGNFTFKAVHPRCPMDITYFGSDDDLGEANETEVKAVQPGTPDVLVVVERVAAGQDRLRGRVVDTQWRSPITSYDVTCSPWRYGHPSPYGGVRISVDDPQGRFEIAHLDPKSRYGLVVEAVNYPAQTFGPFKPSAESDEELSLGRHASLRIVVTDESDTPQPGASVQLVPGLKRGFAAIFTPTLTRRAGTSGVLDWPDLEPTTYSVEAVVGKLRSERVRVDAVPGIATLVQLVVREPAGEGSLELLVQRQDGTARPGVQVAAVLLVDEETSTPGLEPILLGITAGDGRVLFENLPGGTYVIDVEHDGDEIIPIQRVVVPDQGRATLTLGPKG